MSNTIGYIVSELDEIEKEEFFRLKKVLKTSTKNNEGEQQFPSNYGAAAPLIPAASAAKTDAFENLATLNEGLEAVEGETAAFDEEDEDIVV